MTKNRVLLYLLAAVAVAIISQIATYSLWLFLGWVAGVAFVLFVDDEKVVVKKEQPKQHDMLIIEDDRDWTP